MEQFVVREYVSDDYPLIKGNGFEITVMEDRDEVDRFVQYLNWIITTNHNLLTERQIMKGN